MNLDAVKGYSLIKKEYIEEQGSTGYYFRHERTGARVVCIENDDENKVFYIGFCTPQPDSTGVPHIIEHSTLCGSDKYPAKDPFVELAKGSLNTFLNAMTYSDKTVYPLASCNEADFKNIMSVYMDAVFHPNMLKNRMIFEQEGWHYEMETPESELTFNGVVYNEMKGAFSSPEDVLDRYTNYELFPDTIYANESGGDPEEIPSLSYEDFTAFYREYYHPSNSYIYLYGDLDMPERLNWLDREYLSKYDRKEYDSAKMIGKQKPFAAMAEKEFCYGITEEEDEANATYFSWNKVTGDYADLNDLQGLSILEYVLLDSNGAVLRNRLIQKGIGEDVYGGVVPGFYQPFFSVVVKGADPEQKEEFVRTIEESLRELVEKGINKKSLTAAIVHQEFLNREADFGRYPKGLLLGLNLFDTWLYNDDMPFERLYYNDMFEFLRGAVETDYFEQLIVKYLLDNPFGAVVCAYPKKGFTEENERKTAQMLSRRKAAMSKEEIEEIVEHTAALKQYQAEPSSPESLESIPMIHVSDIRREEKKNLSSVKPWEDGREHTETLIHNNVFTSGIAYMSFLFDADHVVNILTDPDGQRNIEYAYGVFSIMDMLFGMLNTEHFDYEELSDEINIATGGLSGRMDIMDRYDENYSNSKVKYKLNVKTLIPKVSDALTLLKEMITTTDYSMDERILELLTRCKSRTENSLCESGHGTAVTRAGSYFGMRPKYSELTTGIVFYEFLLDLIDNYETRKEKLFQDLAKLSRNLFTRENLVVGVTCSEKDLEQCRKQIGEFVAGLPAKSEVARTGGNGLKEYKIPGNNEGLYTAGQVNYDAVNGNYRLGGFDYTGAMRVLTTSLSYDYLWKNVRVLGGAYGCMCFFGLNGGAYMVSYRDPEVKKTYEIYKKLPEYLRTYEADEMEMEKNIIGTIAELDVPRSPSAAGNISFNEYLIGITDELNQKIRDDILNCTAEDIRALADVAEYVIGQNHICTVGNQGKIQADRDLFETVKPLIRS